MSSMPPSLQVFWSGSIPTSPSFASLHSWGEVIGAPMPVALSLRPPSHISSALRRIVDAPQASPSDQPDPITVILDAVQDRREYCGTILRFASDRAVDFLEGDGNGKPEAVAAMRAWLRDVGDVLTASRGDLAELRTRLSEAVTGGRMPTAASDWIHDVADRLILRLTRVHGELKRVAEFLDDRLNAPAMAEIRRRLSWVTSLREFSRSVDWTASSRSLQIPASARADRFETGLVLLDHFREGASKKEIDLYERAATSTVLRDKTIAFDWRGVLGGDFDAVSARAEMESSSEFYDAIPEDLVWQSRRFPFRGVQALLLGLWAAGNHLLFYTDSVRGDEGGEALFNDFPLLKVAFHVTPADRAHEPVTRQTLDASRNYMDALKRRRLGEKHKRFLDEGAGVDLVRYGKIPFPEFTFDVFVGPAPETPVAEMPTPETLKRLGFGDRWLEGTGDAAGLFLQLESHFAKPLAGPSQTVLDWLDTWELP